MTKQITIHLIDEVNVYFEGLNKKQTDHIISKTERTVKGAYQTAAYRLGKWNGKESQFRQDGYTFSYLAPTVMDILFDDFFVGEDTIDIIDHRTPLPTAVESIPYIDKDFLSNTGKTLHEHQVNATNAVIENHKGVVHATTSSGKSLIILAIAKSFDSCFKSLTIVPNTSLVDQIEKDFQSEGTLKYACVRSKHSSEQRKEIIENHDHIIMTWRLLNNCSEFLEGFDGVIMHDELHQCGDVMYSLYKTTLSEAPVRVGLTASLPKDKQKKEKILCHLGGGELINVGTKELQDKGLIADSDITILPIHDPHLDSEFPDWDKEFKYIQKNKRRVNSIAGYVDHLPKKNTVVLCNRKTGIELAQHLNAPFIDKDVSEERRAELYKMFNDHDNCMLVATYGTVGTGISIDRIFRIITLDMGKDITKVIQGIGRGLRKDGTVDYLEVIDMYSELKYGKRHVRDRIKFYKEKQYKYKISPSKLVVE